MKNIVEIIKTNKGVILKRGLIAMGAIAGLTIAGKVLMATAENSEDSEVLVDEETTEEDEDSGEEE